MPTRDDAWNLLCDYTQSESLRKHMLAVEACVRAYARKFGEDEEKWGSVGLLHDFDYEHWPTAPDHPLQGSAILKARGYPDDVIYAIKSHADYLTECPRVSSSSVSMRRFTGLSSVRSTRSGRAATRGAAAAG